MWEPAHRKRGYSSGYHASFIEEENFGLAAYKSLVFFWISFPFLIYITSFFLTYGCYKLGQAALSMSHIWALLGFLTQPGCGL